MHCYRNVVMNTTQSSHWMLSSRQFLRLAVEFLREAGFFYLIWCNLLTSTSPQTWTIWSDLSNCLENESNSWDALTCVERLICPEGRVSSLNKTNPTPTGLTVSWFLISTQFHILWPFHDIDCSTGSPLCMYTDLGSRGYFGDWCLSCCISIWPDFVQNFVRTHNSFVLSLVPICIETLNKKTGSHGPVLCNMSAFTIQNFQRKHFRKYLPACTSGIPLRDMAIGCVSLYPAWD